MQVILHWTIDYLQVDVTRIWAGIVAWEAREEAIVCVWLNLNLITWIFDTWTSLAELEFTQEKHAQRDSDVAGFVQELGWLLVFASEKKTQAFQELVGFTWQACVTWGSEEMRDKRKRKYEEKRFSFLFFSDFFIIWFCN